MHNPTALPEGCTADYFDVVTRAEAMALFPELPEDSFKIDPRYVGDMDKEGLSQVAPGLYDFVVMNHVIEHVANPIRVVSELFRVVRPAGRVVLSCPDKRFNFDRTRELTSFDHLLAEYREGVDTVTDEHYLDFLAHVHPEVMNLPDAQRSVHVEHVRARREHAHVWDSYSFRSFMTQTLHLLRLEHRILYESSGDDNHFEYFVTLEKFG